MDNAEFVGALQQMAQAAVDNTQQVASTLSGLSDKFESVASALEKLGIAAVIADIGKEALAAAQKNAALTASFEALNGAGTSTAELLSKLHDIAENSSFTFGGTLAPAAQNMLMLGVNADTAAKTMQALADQAGALKQGGDYITKISGDLANMDAQLVVNTKSMRALTLDGIPAWQALADEMGTGIPQAMEKVKQGLVSAQTVNDAVVASIEAAHAGAAAQTLDTWQGQFNQLKKMGDDAMEALGDSESSVLQLFAPALKEINAAIQEAINYWKGLSDPVKDAVLAFGAMLAVIPALAGIIGTLTLAFTLLGGPIIWITLAVAGIVAAFTALAVWIDQHRAAIVASIGSIKDAAIDLFSLKWGAVGADLSTAADSFKKVQAATDAAAASNKAAADAAKKSAADQIQAAKDLATQQETNSIIAANQAKVDAAAAKAKEEADAKEKEYQQNVRAGYEYLLTIAPDLAAQYKSAVDMADNGTEAAKKFGKAWNDLTVGFQQQIIAAEALAKEYSYVGITAQTMLDATAARAAISFEAISASGKASAADLVAGQDAVTKKFQAEADYINTDLADALKKAQITQDDYWQGVVDNAAKGLIATQDAFNQGLATASAVTAQQQILDNALRQQHLNSIAELQAAYDTLGIHSQAAWDKSVAGAAAAAARINQAAPDTLAAAQATLDVYQKMYDDLTAQGKVFSQDQQDTFDAQKKKVQDLTPELVALTGAYKTLGEQSVKSLTDQMDALGQAYLDVTKAKDDGKATDTDVYNAQQKLQGAMKSQADLMNGDLKDAWTTQKISADTYYTLVTQRALENAQAMAAAEAAGLKTAGDVTAAWAGYAAAVKDQNAQILKDTVAAYTSIGTQTKPLMDQLVQTNKDHYATISGDAAASATLRISSEADMLSAMQKEHRDFGTTWGTDEQGRLDNDILYLQAHKKTTTDLYVSMWDAIGKAADTGVNNILDSSVDALFKGNTDVWTAVKGAAIDALDSMAKSILHVASDEVMGLLAKKVTELLSGTDGAGGFNAILSAAGKLFGIGGGSGAGGAVDGLPISGTISGVENSAISAGMNAANTATKTATSAASTMASTASSLLGTLSGVGSIVSAVSSVADTLFGYDGIFGQAQKDGNVQNDELLRIFNTVYQTKADDWDRFTQMWAVWAALWGYLDNLLINTGAAGDNTLAMSTTLAAMAKDVTQLLGDFDHFGAAAMNAVTMFASQQLGSSKLSNDTLNDMDAHLASIDTTAKAINVSVIATGVTTKDAAKALGDQIAANLTKQMQPA